MGEPRQVHEAVGRVLEEVVAVDEQQLEDAERDAYLALFDGLDPVDHTARLGDHVLFQWAGKDTFIGQDVRDAYAASSPDARVELYEGSDHDFRDDARVARLAFLEAQLLVG